LIITLGASLFVAFIINPVFAASFMSKDDKAKSNLKTYIPGFILFTLMLIIGYATKNFGLGNFAIFVILLMLLYHFVLDRATHVWQDRVWPRFRNSYRSVLKIFIKGWGPLLVPIGAFVMLILSGLILAWSKPVVELFPSGEPNFVYLYCKLPMGTDASVTDSITQGIEKRVYKVIGEHNPDVTSVITNVGLGAGDPQNPDKVATPYKSKVTVAFKKYADRKDPHTSKWLNAIRNEFKSGVSGAQISVEKEANGPPVGKAINIEINGDDFKILTNLQNKIMQNIDKANIKGIDELKSDLQISKPEIAVELDNEKLQREGLSKGQVASELRTALFGKEASKYRDVDDDIPIQVRLDKKYRQNIDQLMNLNISFMDFATGSFRQLPISSIATVRYSNSYSVINRKNQKRVVTLSSDVTDGYAANDVVASIQEVINNMDIPEGYEVKMTGEQEQQQETSSFLGVAFALALSLMFMIMVTQFDSAVKPMIIGTTVLFSLIGVFLGNAIFHMRFSVVMTGVGFFALSGIVIRNGILLIEFIDELRQRGYSVKEAVIEGGAIRMTPVILTAMSAILGLIPLAIGLNIDFEKLFSELNPHIYLGGDNVAFWGPLAWTMIFGLIGATFLTLLVVPSMYMLGYNTRDWFRNKFGKKGEETPKG